MKRPILTLHDVLSAHQSGRDIMDAFKEYYRNRPAEKLKADLRIDEKRLETWADRPTILQIIGQHITLMREELASRGEAVMA